MNLTKSQLDQYIHEKIAELNALSDSFALRAKASQILIEIRDYLYQELDAEKRHYAVGDKGPSGGTVFWVNAQGTQGLECKVDDERIENKRMFTWQEALAFQKEGWVVPDQHQLDQLWRVRDQIPNLKNNAIDYNAYWSSTAYDDTTAMYQYFGSGQPANLIKSYKASVRLIKSF